MDDIFDEIDLKFDKLIDSLRDAKPDERSEIARRFAIVVTEVEKAHAYFLQFVKPK